MARKEAKLVISRDTLPEHMSVGVSLYSAA